DQDACRRRDARARCVCRDRLRGQRRRDQRRHQLPGVAGRQRPRCLPACPWAARIRLRPAARDGERGAGADRHLRARSRACGRGGAATGSRFTATRAPEEI
ncbi:MAG: hypothetical protein AVDCRST_MAG67-4150, partial [uncultured Solirubrobacteraceae bacterium]